VSNGLIAALSDQEVVQVNPLATVTRDCVVILDSINHSQTILFVSRVSSVKLVRHSYPGLLVISAGLFVLGAAAFASKDGRGAGLPLVLLAIGFAVAYIGTRRAAVGFKIGSATIETLPGSIKDAKTLAQAVEAVRRAHIYQTD